MASRTASKYRPGSFPPDQRVRTAPGPDPPGFKPVASLRDVKTPVPRVLLSISLAGPAHLAVLTRRFVRAAPVLPGTTQIRLPSATLTCYDRPDGEGLSPPLEPQRLTAQLEAEPGTQVRRRPLSRARSPPAMRRSPPRPARPRGGPGPARSTRSGVAAHPSRPACNPP